jgi:hypothetical protein
VFVFFFKVPPDAEFRKMVEAVFSDPKLQERLAANFVALSANADFDGQALAKKFGIVEFPQYGFFDDNGNKFYSASGYANTGAALAVLDKAIDAAPAHLKPRADNLPALPTRPPSSSLPPHEELRKPVFDLVHQLDTGAAKTN